MHFSFFQLIWVLEPLGTGGWWWDGGGGNGDGGLVISCSTEHGIVWSVYSREVVNT